MYLLIVSVVIIAGIFITILLNSPGKPKPFIDSSGKIIEDSISEKNSVSIGDANLGFFVKGKNKNNPVLLYLHGGMPDYFLTEKYPTALDELFTVVWLDQRGAGLSFNPKDVKKQMDIEDMIGDIKDFTNYLRARFSQEKIYLMAHSGGTYLGIKVIERYPELFAAYIGIAQISYQKLSEKKAYDYIIEQYQNDPKRKKVYQQLLLNPFDLQTPISAEYTKYRDYAMHDLGVGTMKNMKNVITGLFLPSLFFDEYSFSDKINLWRGKAGSGISIIWNELINHDLMQESTSFVVPIYFLHGVHDYTCSYELAKEYFDTIEAPDKGFYSFEHSAHSPIFEEPNECIRIIGTEILSKSL